MDQNNSINIAAARDIAKAEEVTVQYNEEVLKITVRAMTTGLLTINEAVHNVLSRDEIEESFTYALKIALSACTRTQGEGRKCNDPIPVFMTDLIRSLSLLARGVRVTTNYLEPGKRPDSYTDLLNVLATLGLPSGKVYYPDFQDQSSVLEYDVRERDGVLCLFGENEKPNLDDLIVRYMFKLVDDERQKLVNILGRSGLYYCSGDELVRNWAASSIRKVKAS